MVGKLVLGILTLVLSTVAVMVAMHPPATMANAPVVIGFFAAGALVCGIIFLKEITRKQGP